MTTGKAARILSTSRLRSCPPRGQRAASGPPSAPQSSGTLRISRSMAARRRQLLPGCPASHRATPPSAAHGARPAPPRAAKTSGVTSRVGPNPYRPAAPAPAPAAAAEVSTLPAGRRLAPPTDRARPCGVHQTCRASRAGAGTAPACPLRLCLAALGRPLHSARGHDQNVFAKYSTPLGGSSSPNTLLLSEAQVSCNRQ